MIEKTEKKPKYLSDFVYSIIATLLSTGVMQLVVLPQLSRTLSSAEYGVMLTATGLMNILINAFGNNLCNSRLRQQVKYTNKQVKGDYQILLLAASGLALVTVLLSYFYLKTDFFRLIIPLAIISVTGIWRAYYLVTYRLSIDFRRNLRANICGCIGYLIGGFFLIYYVAWPWVFFPADFFLLIYICFSSDIVREPIKKTELFSDSARVTSMLLVGGLIGNVTIYLDRIILYPVLGSESVSTYATAAWFSKSILMIMSPITSVLLSYITAGKLKLNKTKYDKVCLLLLAGAAVCWGGAIVFAPVITGFFYPDLIESAKPYIVFVSLAVVIGIIGNFLAIMVLAYAPVKWQTVIPLIKVVIYAAFGVVLSSLMGIEGMIIAVFVANLVFIIISYFVARKWVREELIAEDAQK